MMEADDIILITGANGLVGSHLLALLHHAKGGADGNFGFAETNVTANEAIHGLFF